MTQNDPFSEVIARINQSISNETATLAKLDARIAELTEEREKVVQERDKVAQKLKSRESACNELVESYSKLLEFL